MNRSSRSPSIWFRVWRCAMDASTSTGQSTASGHYPRNVYPSNTPQESRKYQYLRLARSSLLTQRTHIQQLVSDPGGVCSGVCTTKQCRHYLPQSPVALYPTHHDRGQGTGDELFMYLVPDKNVFPLLLPNFETSFQVPMYESRMYTIRPQKQKQIIIKQYPSLVLHLSALHRGFFFLSMMMIRMMIRFRVSRSTCNLHQTPPLLSSLSSISSPLLYQFKF